MFDLIFGVIGDLLFIISMIVCIMNFFIMVGLIFGKTIDIPFPILHVWGVKFNSIYLTFLSMGYQIYFWFTYFQIL